MRHQTPTAVLLQIQVLCERPVVYNVLKGQSAFLCRFKQFKAAQNPEDEGTTIHQSIGNYVLRFLLGNSPASEFYMPTFRNTLSVPSSWAGRCRMTKFENSWAIHTGEGLAQKQPQPTGRRVTG